jgi:transcriptional regulator of acetoin/glycerol metabolism
LSKDTLIGVNDLPDILVVDAGRSDPTTEANGYFELRDAHLQKFERQYLEELLIRHQGDVRAASAEARLPRGTLYRLLKTHGLDAGQYR